MRRTNLIIITVAIVTLGVANILVATRDRKPSTPSTPWDRWCELPAPRRAACVQKHLSLARQANAKAILRDARRFGDLPPERQEYLRQLRHTIQETLAALPDGRRLDLLRLSPRARAFMIYQTLRSDQPKRLAELRIAAERSR